MKATMEVTAMVTRTMMTMVLVNLPEKDFKRLLITSKDNHNCFRHKVFLAFDNKTRQTGFYSVKVPINRIAPEVVSLIMNMKGWSQLKCMTVPGPGEVSPFIT